MSLSIITAAPSQKPTPTTDMDVTSGPPATVSSLTSLPPETNEDTIFGFDKKLYDWLIIAGIGVLSLIIVIIIICVCYRCICHAQGSEFLQFF